MDKEIKNILDRFLDRAGEVTAEAYVNLALKGLIGFIDPITDKSVRMQRLKDDLQNALDLYNSHSDDDDADAEESVLQ